IAGESKSDGSSIDSTVTSAASSGPLLRTGTARTTLPWSSNAAPIASSGKVRDFWKLAPATSLIDWIRIRAPESSAARRQLVLRIVRTPYFPCRREGAVRIERFELVRRLEFNSSFRLYLSSSHFSAARARPATACSGSGAPSNVRLGRLSSRHRAWTQER